MRSNMITIHVTEIPWNNASGARDGDHPPCSSEMRCVNDVIVKSGGK